MALFNWNNRLAIWVPALDDEHRAIFSIGADLEQAVATKAPHDRICEIVHALAEHAEKHFAHEERMMRQTHYQAFEWHKRQHDGARRRLKQLAKRIAADDPEAPTELVAYLAQWVRDHISVTDRMMAARLRSFEHQHVAVA
jgi:hemerythrin